MMLRVFFAGRYGPDVARYRRFADAIGEALKRASTLLKLELSMVRPDDLESGDSVTDAIRQQIRQADLIIADLSGGSPNVVWELGFAQALEKSVLLLSEDAGHVPFDLRDHQVILYDPNSSFSNLVIRLSESIVDVLRSRLSRSSPRAAKSKRRRRRIFFSYSHADEAFLRRMLVHLRPLERNGLIDLWCDVNLKAGDSWREEIQRALADARIAVLLISADFLASEFIITNELPPLLVAAEKKGTRIIPVIVKPSRFLRDERLSRFHALNDPINPAIGMSEAEREALYARLAENIELELGVENVARTSEVGA